MQTKGDDFVKRVKQVKKLQIKQKKSSGFWKKLLAVIGIITLVGLLFKDKIAKLLPDLSGSLGDTTNNVILWIKNSISGVVEYINSVASKVISSILQYIAGSQIPKFVGQFFNLTLPNAIYGSVMAIMSIFSDDAAKQLNEFVRTQMKDAAEGLSDSAEDRIGEDGKLLDFEYDFDSMTYAQLEELKGMWQLDHLVSKDNGTFVQQWLKSIPIELKVLMQTGEFDYAKFYSSINQLSNDADGFTESDLKKAILTAAGNKANTISNLQDVGANMLAKFKQLPVTAYGQQYKKLTSTMQKHKQKMLQDAKNGATTGTGGNVPIQKPTFTPTVTNTIQIPQVLTRIFAARIDPLLLSIVEILGVQTGSHSRIVTAVSQFFNVLSNKCNQYFLSSMVVLGTIMDKWNHVLSGSFTYQSYAPPSSSDNVPNGVQVTNEVMQKLTNLMIININIDDVYIRQWTSQITQLHSIDRDICEQIKKGNDSLYNVLYKIDGIKSNTNLSSGDIQKMVIQKSQQAILGQQKIRKSQDDKLHSRINEILTGGVNSSKTPPSKKVQPH